MPDRKVLINQSLAAFARKSDATFTRAGASFAAVICEKRMFAISLWLAINLHA
jgi:hypothetical protein